MSKNKVSKGVNGLTKLSELDAKEVSLVPRGANKRKFVILKSAESKISKGEAMPPKAGAPAMTPLQHAIANPDPEVMKKVQGTIEKYSGVKKEPEKEAPPPVEKEVDGQELGSDAQSAIKAVVRILAPFKGKISPELVHEVLDVAGHEIAGSNSEGEGDMGADVEKKKEEEKEGSQMAVPEKVEGVEKGHMDEAVEKACSAFKEHMEKLGYQKYPTAESAIMKSKAKPESEDEDEIEKSKLEKEKGEPVAKADLSTDAKIREAIEKQDVRLKEAVAKGDKLEAQLKARDVADKKKEIVQKAASFRHVALPQEDIVASLEEAASISPKSYERVCKSFETLNEQGRTSNVFAEYGSNLSSTGSTPDDFEAKINRMAEGIVQKSGDVKLTKEAAYAMALQSPEGQRLYSEFKANRKGGV